MLSKPIVSKPDLVSTGPRQLGYFPDDTIARIHAISKLKQEGYSMSEIATRLDATAEAAPAFAPVSGSMPTIPATNIAPSQRTNDGIDRKSVV